MSEWSDTSSSFAAQHLHPPSWNSRSTRSKQLGSFFANHLSKRCDIRKDNSFHNSWRCNRHMTAHVWTPLAHQGGSSKQRDTQPVEDSRASWGYLDLFGIFSLSFALTLICWLNRRIVGLISKNLLVFLVGWWFFNVFQSFSMFFNVFQCFSMFFTYCM